MVYSLVKVSGAFELIFRHCIRVSWTHQVGFSLKPNPRKEVPAISLGLIRGGPTTACRPDPAHWPLCTACELRTVLCLLFLSSPEDKFSLLWGGERDRERETLMWERYTDQSPPVQAPTRNGTRDLSVYRMMLQLSHTSQGSFTFLMLEKKL